MKDEELVRYLLKNYYQIKRDIEGKKVLLKQMVCESEEEVIEGINFKSFQEEKVTHSYRADKTANEELQ